MSCDIYICLGIDTHKWRKRERGKETTESQTQIYIYRSRWNTPTVFIYVYTYYTLHDLYTHPERWRSNVIQVKTRKSVVCMDSHWITGTQKNDGHLDGIPNLFEDGANS